MPILRLLPFLAISALVVGCASVIRQPMEERLRPPALSDGIVVGAPSDAALDSARFEKIFDAVRKDRLHRHAP